MRSRRRTTPAFAAGLPRFISPYSFLTNPGKDESALATGALGRSLMPFQPELVPLAWFVALMAIAAFDDFRRLVIPNGVIVGLSVLWPFYLASSPTGTLLSAIAALGCGFAVFFAGALLFSRGLVGGGDVKLLAAATLWAGPSGILPLLALTGLLGGLLGLFALLPFCRDFSALRQRSSGGPSEVAAGEAAPVVVPYGVAIAAAALIVTVPRSFN
jgi:prepilin peptidase CpaA